MTLTMTAPEQTRARHPDQDRREREQRVLDAVVGQDHQRTLGAQPLREDPGGCRTHPLAGDARQLLLEGVAGPPGEGSLLGRQGAQAAVVNTENRNF